MNSRAIATALRARSGHFALAIQLNSMDTSELDSIMARVGHAVNRLALARPHAALARRNLGTTNELKTTSVAYIVLYIVTAVVCLLFVLIIGAGALRAARHPERYGRHRLVHAGAGGQQRQQGVVKGLSQAVLDSFPIVSFGARREQRESEAERGEAGQEGKEGIELGPVESQATGLTKKEEQVDTPTKAETTEVQADMTTNTALPAERDVTDHAIAPSSDVGPATASTPTPTAAPAAETPAIVAAAVLISDDFEDGSNATTCPICVEDFEAGDQVRVLPCDGRHRFHAECVDPYLLKHSSLCPLCRKDLKPAAPTPPEQDVNAADGEGAEGGQRGTRRGRRMSELMVGLTARRRADADGGDGRTPRTRAPSGSGTGHLASMPMPGLAPQFG